MTQEEMWAPQFLAAARTAGQAPSIHNTQPWRWRLRRSVADLHADTRRQLRSADMARRLLTISCGAALHHFRVCLAADGVAAEVNLLPTIGDPLHLAQVTAAGSCPVSGADSALRNAISRRRTDRRQMLPVPVPQEAVAVMRSLTATYGCGLHFLGHDDVVHLAEATARSQHSQLADPATRHELDVWTGNRREQGTGIPDSSILAAPLSEPIPARDFGHIGSLPVMDHGRSSARYAILYGPDDEPGSWLRAGQALSTLWLYATTRDVAVLPLSAPIESSVGRQALSALLGGVRAAHLVVRLGIADRTSPPSPRTPRLPVEATVTIIA